MAMITADPKDVPNVEHFAFTPDYLAKAKALMANYPPGRQASAVIGVLDLAQRLHPTPAVCGWPTAIVLEGGYHLPTLALNTETFFSHWKG